MGPLVPDIIGNELNFIVALLIGILFGAVLEQAGFSRFVLWIRLHRTQGFFHCRCCSDDRNYCVRSFRND